MSKNEILDESKSKSKTKRKMIYICATIILVIIYLICDLFFSNESTKPSVPEYMLKNALPYDVYILG